MNGPVHSPWTTRVVACGAVAFIAGTGTAVAVTGDEHGLSQRAVEIARPFGFPVTNSMLVTWIVAVSLIVFAQLATRNMKQVPDGAQNVLEWLIESLYGFLEGIIGAHLIRRTFWFFGTIFIFILAANWVGLIPGVGSIGWGQHTAGGFSPRKQRSSRRQRRREPDAGYGAGVLASWIVWVPGKGPVGFFRSCSRRRVRARAR